jgi:hypothetical protein
MTTGIDAYWDVIKINDRIKTKVLTFIAAERISLSKELLVAQDNVEQEQVYINGISYQLLFAGIGATISW